MAETTAIEWTDATVNFWWGCTKVGPGCDHCYAEAWSKRTGGDLWGVGAPRRKIKGAVALMHRLDNDYSWWAADCHIGGRHPNSRRRVFAQSMSDLFDTEAPLEWFDEAWTTIHACNRIDVQIVTKRSAAVEKRIAAASNKTWPKHAGLIFTVVNQAEADRDIPRLIDLMQRFDIPWVGLSCEPMLGQITLPEAFLALGKRAWVIAGGESGPEARPMHPDWPRALRDQCAAAGVPFLFKQWGEYLPVGQSLPGYGKVHGATAVKPGRMKLHYGGTPNQPPNQAFAEHGVRFASGNDGRLAFRVGKKAAGNMLDGRQHLEFPR